MAIPGSATYKATYTSEGNAARSTIPSPQSTPPDAIHGADWVVSDPRAFTSKLGVSPLWSLAGTPDAPNIVSLTPASALVPGDDFELIVNGSNFTPDSIINWNGGDEPTEFIDESHISTIVKPSTVEAPLPFTLDVYVKNGEENSNSLPFTFEASPEDSPHKRSHHKKHG